MRTGTAADASAGADGAPKARYAQVALAGGLTLWGVVGQDGPIGDNAPVLACIRKEHIAVRPSPDAGTQGLPGQIKAASFLGLQEEYLVAAGPVEMRAIQGPSVLKAGDRVAATIRPEDCIVLLEGDGSSD